MKKLFFVFIVLCLIGCGGAHDPYLNYRSVVEKYPGKEVVRVPNQSYRFLVIGDEDILYVETMGLVGTDITAEYKIYTFRKRIE